jgi:hypothetical protein
MDSGNKKVKNPSKAYRHEIEHDENVREGERYYRMRDSMWP